MSNARPRSRSMESHLENCLKPECDVCASYREDFATDIAIMHRNENYSYAIANPETMNLVRRSRIQLPLDYHDFPDDGPFHDTRARQISYELAGRSSDHTFKDLRSTHKAKRRRLTEKEKYWGYLAVKRGQLDVPHYILDDERWPGGNSPSWTHTVLPSEAETTIMDKHMLYSQAQGYPRPPKYHYSHRWDKLKYLPRKQAKHRVSKERVFDEATYAIDPLGGSETYVVMKPDANTDIFDNADCYAGGGVTWAFIARKLEDHGVCEHCGKNDHRHVDGAVHCDDDDDAYREYAFREYDGQLDDVEWAELQAAYQAEVK